ncbi:MAG: hypothetical protein EOO04_32805, partial [Chitinophagaceae bacterium]
DDDGDVTPEPHSSTHLPQNSEFDTRSDNYYTNSAANIMKWKFSFSGLEVKEDPKAIDVDTFLHKVRDHCQSENITVRRIVDRYLEHGRVFIFHNAGDIAMFMGSSDWMNRNIYHRIEVCFPILDPDLKTEMYRLIDLQLQDNIQAVMLDQQLNNVPIENNAPALRSQAAIYDLLASDLPGSY